MLLRHNRSLTNRKEWSFKRMVPCSHNLMFSKCGEYRSNLHYPNIFAVLQKWTFQEVMVATGIIATDQPKHSPFEPLYECNEENYVIESYIFTRRGNIHFNCNLIWFLFKYNDKIINPISPIWQNFYTTVHQKVLILKLQNISSTRKRRRQAINTLTDQDTNITSLNKL